MHKSAASKQYGFLLLFFSKKKSKNAQTWRVNFGDGCWDVAKSFR